MYSPGPGLEEALEVALGHWQKAGGGRTDRRFGAAGQADPKLDDELFFLATSANGGRPDQFGSPMDRLFATEIGRRAANVVGNETRTLAALDRLSVEIMAESLRVSGQARDQDRLLVMSQQHGRPPMLMLMSPDVADVRDSRIVSDGADLPLPLLREGLSRVSEIDRSTPEGAALREVLEGGVGALAGVFLISRPEIVLTRRPRMIPLCVPLPHMRVEAGGKVSTAGVLCRDAEGALGVTACYHGTGPVGADVTVDRHKSRVKHASEVQDLVFIPLGPGFNVPTMAGLGGVLANREPARSDRVRFDGVINQNQRTRVISTDAGMLRERPTIMLKLQTDPDTDQGDSGSALLDEQDKVLGFAFERTAYDDHPQFTDWIWAANALRALRLTPHRAGE